VINENDVVGAVSVELRSRGWIIDAVKRTNQRGEDIEAHRGDESLSVEAKGGTSSNETSPRYGKPFDRSQVTVHVSRAVMAALKITSAGGRFAAIALPEDRHHRDMVDSIRVGLERAEIAVIWVDDNLNVTIESQSLL
jgi:hypothetical protein